MGGIGEGRDGRHRASSLPYISLLPLLLFPYLFLFPACRKELPAPVEGPAAPERPRLPEDRDPSPCRVTEVTAAGLSQQGLLSEAAVLEAIRPLVAGEFPETERGTGPGFRLRIEYALRQSEDHGEGGGTPLFFGVRGTLRRTGGAPPMVLEEDVSKDLSLPAGCAGSVGAEGCGVELGESVRAPLGDLVHRLGLACRLAHCEPGTMEAALRSADAWQRARGALAAGDCREKSLVDLLVSVSGDREQSVVLPAIGALGRLGAARAVPDLVRRARAAEEPVVLAVAVALSDIGTEEALRYLREWERYHPLPSVRERAGELLSGPPVLPIAP